MALAFVDDLKVLLGITGSTQDQLLDLLLAGSQAAVESYCDRNFEATDYTEFYSGNGLSELPLRQWPVIDNTDFAVYLDVGGSYGKGTNAFASTTLLTQGTDYVLDWKDSEKSGTGLLIRLGSNAGIVTTTSELGWVPNSITGNGGWLSARRKAVWPAVRGCLKVVYRAGYEAGSVPADLSQAVLELAAYMKLSGPFGGDLTMGSESLGPYSVSYISSALAGNPALGGVRSLLLKYKRVSLP